MVGPPSAIGSGKRNAELDDVGTTRHQEAAISSRSHFRIRVASGERDEGTPFSARKPREKVCWILDMEVCKWSAPPPDWPAGAR